MELNFIAVMIFMAGLYGLFVGVLLILQSSENSLSRRLLGISVLSYSWFCLMTGCVYSRLFYQFPHLFRTVWPLIYLIAPTSYLYVRSIAREQTKFKNWDWVHFIPAIFVFVELMPFYLSSSSEKLRVINYYMKHQDDLLYLNEGFMEKHFHLIARSLLAVIYEYRHWRILFEFLSKVRSGNKRKCETLSRWMCLYTLCITVTFTFTLIINVFSKTFKAINDIGVIILALQLFIISVALLLKPRILFSWDGKFTSLEALQQHIGTARVAEPELAFASIPVTAAPISQKQEKQRMRKEAIINMLENRECFKIPGYSLSAMASELDIPVKVISAIINEEFDTNFTGLINQYRINYIIQRVKGQALLTYTLESIASEAGFRSRTTFYRSFIKFTGQAPTDYFKALI